MITLDTLRPALLSDQPWTELDQLVRSEQSAGRRVKDIHAELSALVDPARDTFNLTEDADDALMDTLDALVGNCAPRWRYTDPPTIPIQEEIAALPRWARVAFAARCARRVLPLYKYRRPDTPDSDVSFAKYAVEVTEQSAATGTVDVRVPDTLKEFAAINLKGSGPAHDALAIVEISGGGTDAGYIAAAVQEAASDSAYFKKAASDPNTVAAIRLQFRRDFDYLARLAEWKKWTNDSPVSPDVFGPLWPEGPPPGWPADPDLSERTDLLLELLSRAKYLEQVTEDEAVNLFNAINAYYIARTGNRLTMDGYKALLAALVPAEV